MLDRLIYAVRKILKKPFKVGIVSYYYPEKFNLNNGVAIHTYYLSRELAKLGCEIHIFCKGDRNSIRREYIHQGEIIIHRIGVKSKLPIQEDNVLQKRISYFMFDNQVINEITRENKTEPFDIIHTHGWLTSGAFIAKYFNDIKWIHTFHALEKNRLKFMSEEEKKYFEIVRWMESTIKNADALITVSESLKREVLQNYPVSEKKIHYIPNGVDLELFKPTNLPKEKIILYVGRFSLEKGIDVVFKIANNVLEKDKELKFVIVASDSNIPKSLEKLSEKFNELLKKYPDRFIWHKENLNRIELSNLYNESLIYIQPSRYESFGLCVLEAMACGKAIIVSNKGGLSEVVENAGMVIPLNTNLFVIKIFKLLKNYRLRERYIRRAVERAKLFDWTKVASQIFELYQNIKEQK